jgi:hypothetical protein
MRKISFQKHNIKRQNAKAVFLNIKDSLENKKSKSLRERDRDKQLLLFKLAKDKQQKTFKKVGKRKYKVLS